MAQSNGKRDPEAGAAKPVLIKKYANRRLYNTSTSSYVTLDDLSKMVKGGTEFEVSDAKTGEDITRQVLTHIIVEEESKGQNLLPISFLRHLISFYGDSLQAVVPTYLEQTMQSFARNQEQMRDYMKDAFGGLNPFGGIEELSKQNITLVENAMKMFTPFYSPGFGPSPGTTDRPSESPMAAKPAAGSDIDELRTKMLEMQNQLDRLTGRK